MNYDSKCKFWISRSNKDDNIRRINSFYTREPATSEQNAAIEVNKINEELAKIILSLDTETVNKLAEYCQLQAVPDDFPFAKKANLFFFLNPRSLLDRTNWTRCYDIYTCRN